MRFQTSSPHETAQLSKQILEKISNHEHTEAIVIALSGDLGAGKTTLTKGIADELGILDTVTSPTFVVLKKYDIPETSRYHRYFSSLIHIDAYRLQDARDTKTIGLDEMIRDRQNIIIIEWPERVADIFSNNTIYINIEHHDINSRTISIKGLE